MTSEWLKSLNKNLKVVRKTSDDYPVQLVLDKTKENAEAGKANQFQRGDLVLYDTLYSQDKFRTPKLNSRHSGPWKVKKHTENDVEVQYLCLGNIEVKLAERPRSI